MATFSAAGFVEWPRALVMMAAATAGGYAGAPLARALPQGAVRGIVAAVGLSMIAVFLWRLMA